nr:uncharacterized protein LOC128696871 [Cherax quadricarinatus]
MTFPQERPPGPYPIELASNVSNIDSLLHFHQCRPLFTIDKGSYDTIWNTDSPYQELSRHLPSLFVESPVRRSANDSQPASIYPGTRLDLLNGSVPFIPCRVKQYEAGELEACTAARRARGATTWVAFVGDSTMRQKIHSFLSFLPPQLTYTYLIGDTEVTEPLQPQPRPPPRSPHAPTPHNASGYHSSNGSSHTPAQRTDGEYNSANRGMHIVNNRNTGRKIYDVHSSNNGTFLKNPEKTKINSAGIKNKGIIEYSSKPLLEADTRLESYDLRVTLVWAPTGSTMDHPTPRTGRKVTKLHDLATAIVVPDVVVVGLGTWVLLMREHHDELVPFTELDLLVRPVMRPLALLAARTPLLVWAQSRYRWFNFESPKASAGIQNLKAQWGNMLYFSQFNDTIPFTDSWLWRQLRSVTSTIYL